MRRLLFAATLIASVAGYAIASDAELERLRADYARHFFTADTHLRLARYLAEHGQPLTGFYLSEAARRQYFEDNEFQAAVRHVYRDDHFDNSGAAEEKLKSQIASAPADPAKLAALADVYLSRGEWKKAEEQLRRAVARSPESFEYVNVLAEVLRRDGRTKEGDTLEAEWLASHPESLEAWQRRVTRAMDGEPAEAAKVMAAALAKFPNDATLRFNNSLVLQKAGNLEAAAKEIERAAALDPKSVHIQGWTARFFLKARNDHAKALDYYLRAYFLDPDFYDSEYAESRIRTITNQIDGPLYASRVAAGASAVQLLRDADPLIAGYALEHVEKEWRPEYRDAMFALLSHDDPSTRYGAARMLGEHGDDDVDAELIKLLTAPDLRVRSAAAYAAGRRLHERIVPILETWLDSDADLLRYDAVSILLEHGGAAGKARLVKLRDSGTVRDERLKAMLESIDKPGAQ